jgi:large subunit ribosomal protein L35
MTVPGPTQLTSAELTKERYYSGNDAWSEKEPQVKQKNHSGAKKRMTLLKSGKVKCKQSGMRHLLSPHKSKGKRHAGMTDYVNDANMGQVKRLLNF